MSSASRSFLQSKQLNHTYKMYVCSASEAAYRLLAVGLCNERQPYLRVGTTTKDPVEYSSFITVAVTSGYGLWGALAISVRLDGQRVFSYMCFLRM